MRCACLGSLWFWQDEDEEQGTLKFGKQKEQASYGGMDEEEKAIWKVTGFFRSPLGLTGIDCIVYVQPVPVLW